MSRAIFSFSLDNFNHFYNLLYSCRSLYSLLLLNDHYIEVKLAWSFNNFQVFLFFHYYYISISINIITTAATTYLVTFFVQLKSKCTLTHFIFLFDQCFLHLVKMIIRWKDEVNGICTLLNRTFWITWSALLKQNLTA